MSAPKQDESKRLPTYLKWVVHCPRHGERAQLFIEGLHKKTPDLARCSLRPDDLPPSCDQACMGALNVHPADPSAPASAETPDPS